MINMHDKLQAALRCSEIFGDSLFDILRMEDRAFDDWVNCCEERIAEEMRRRIETGIVIPIKELRWAPVGCDGWSHGKVEVPF